MTAIKSVETWRMPTVAIKETWTSSTSPWPTTPINYLVKVTLESGVYGVGEINTQLWYLNETPEQLASVVALYNDALKGIDGSNIAHCHDRMLKCYGGGSPGARSARSGVDMALWDALGKELGLPVYKLLGGGNATNIPLMFCTYQDTPELAVRDCLKAVNEGFQAIKVKVGDRLHSSGWNIRNLWAEADKLAAVLEAVPDHILIDADANQGWWNAGMTVSILRGLTAFRNLSIEQPLGYDDISGAAHVRKVSGIPLILDESVWSAEAMIQIVQAEACDRIVCKLNRLGGFYEARKVIAICEAAGIGVAVDTAPYTLLGDTAVFHAAATCKTIFPVDEGHLSFIAIRDESPFTGGVDISNGLASLPDFPGLGIEVNWSIVENWQAS